MPETRDHIHEIEIAGCSVSRAFQALITPSDIQNWWSASRAIVIPKLGGTWTATWGDDEDNPDYIASATVAKFESDRCLKLTDYVYQSPDGGLPFEADLQTEFEVEPTLNGVKVIVRQTGFPLDPIADDFFAGCDEGWRQTLSAMRDYLAS